MRTLTLALVSSTVALLASAEAGAFEYLEHTYFGDLGCREAQRRLAPLVAQSSPKDPVVARYVALSLFCPLETSRPYCAEGYKQVEAHINLLEEPPAESGDYAVTLGDYAALADHLSDFGPLRGYPRAGHEGLVLETLTWMAEEPDGAGGVVGDVAEDGCEPSVPVSWPSVDADVRAGLGDLDRGGLGAWSDELALPSRRSTLPLGPKDPATVYSFDNPHYLDLILRNHNHFGAPSYATWLGFHSAAWDTASQTCPQALGLDEDQLEDIADELEAWDDAEWDEMSASERAEQGCAMLREVVASRIDTWRRRAPEADVAPVLGALEGLDAGKGEPRELLDRVTVAIMGLVAEGVGLHFLHDTIAGGHIRTDRSARGLGESRYDHDEDSKHGIIARYPTAGGQVRLVAFGDGYILGPELPASACASLVPGKARPEVVAGCLRQRQRALLVALGAASLMDWALGGVMYEREGLGCGDLDTPEGYVCQVLPLGVPVEPGVASISEPQLEHGTLPLPPPPFGYESVRFALGVDLSGDDVQAGVRLTFLSELDTMANWMTSYNGGVLSGFGRQRGTVLGEFSYQFHWRWAARFLINAGPFIRAGVRGFDGHNRFEGAVGPVIGTSLLPEGWIKLPLQFDLSYQAPLLVVGEDEPVGTSLGGHVFEVAVGLAYF